MSTSKLKSFTMNFRIFILSLFLIFGLISSISAQMDVNGQTLYGNEWINYNQSYYKINVAEDGIYQLSFQDLVNAGVFSESNVPTGSDFKLYRNGKIVSTYVSTSGSFGTNDFIEFYGVKNRGEIDQHLYVSPSDQLNPEYSMFTDESTYFLTWNSSPVTSIQGIANDLQNPPTAESFCNYEASAVYNSKNVNGRDYGSSSWKCGFDEGEGYGSSKVANLNVNLSLNDIASGTAKVETRFYSVSPIAHDVALSLNGSNIYDESFTNWQMKNYNVEIPSSDLNVGNNTFTLTASNSPEDKFHLAYLTVEYPRLLQFNGSNYAEFSLPAASGKRYLEINNFDVSGNAPILMDITNNLRVITTVTGSTIKAVLPDRTGDRKLVLYHPNAISNVNSIAKRDFIEYDFANGNYDYIMVTHPYFYDDGNGNNYIQEYANYRATLPGGEYTPLIADVTQIYDQFGYGIERHEMAIKNFMKKAEISWAPKLLYLIGKGVIYDKMRTEANEWAQFSFVPSFGFPSSDHLFVTPNNSFSPAMGVGRLACKDAGQLKLYLDKVIEYENAQIINGHTYNERAWMKRILHFGGGDEDIQNFIKSELNELKDSIEVSEMAADVVSFFKNSTGVIGEVPLDQVVPLINEGAGMLTFFGHSAPSTLDFDLGNPNEYQNDGKYPFFYAIGCNTNRIFEVESTLSEDYVFIENKGCIGFFGATWITSLGSLSQYAREFYDNVGNDEYGATLGKIIKTTIDDYSQSSSYTAELLRNSLVLHGDPAVKLYPYETPDYIVNDVESNIDPSIVNIQEDSFDLNLVVTNLGKGIRDSFNILLQNELPNGTLINLGTRRIEAPNFQRTYVFRLPIQPTNSIGSNYIQISLDYDDEIFEDPAAAESNNFAKVPFFVVSNDIFPVYPYDFSIISDNDPILKASTANVFSETLDYYFEIDTTELFNSPLNESTVITESGGVLDWNPAIPMIDSTVYYWRVSIDSTAIAGNGFNWHNSSFVYIDANPPGWNQSHYYQFIKDDFNDYEIDPVSRTQSYGDQEKQIAVVNNSYPNLGWIEIALFEEGFKEITAWPCPGHNEVIIMAIYDPVTLTRRVNPSNGMGAAPNCWDVPIDWFIFYSDSPAERAKIMNTLNTVAQDDDYVIFYNVFRENNPQNLDVNNWAADSISNSNGENIFNLLEAQGASQIRNLETEVTPYIFAYQKNNTEFSPIELIGQDPSDEVEASFAIKGLGVEGWMYSTEIGPASSWETLLWNVDDYDPTTESVEVDIMGISANGTETLVMDNISVFNQPLSTIDAALYPNIKLIYHSQDTIGHTTPQLDYWRVHYVPIPEAALVPNKLFTFQSDTLEQGAPLEIAIGIENISDVDMDSLLMSYTIIGSDNSQVITTDRIKPLVKGDMIVGELTYDTRNLTGLNRIIIEANPNDDQVELHHYNNIGIREFFINNDQRNPLLDVTFDGRRIMDGDLVASSPEIIISLLDENPYLALSDTSLLRVFLTDPENNVSEYYVDGSTLIFFPADANNLSQENKAKMEFRPSLTIDGIYELEVRGKDATGNNSGDLAYRVQFEIVNEELVSNMLNYPNPFSTSTQFVFTLTGNELPDYMKIQIMTVSGKIVREITMDELGPLRIGDNITEYKWDGTDEYGDKLANGVYVYRVVVKKDGEDYEKYDTGTNKFFKQGFGKMMILR